MNEEFELYHQKSTPYHPHANGTVESLKNIFENALTKIFNVNRDDWDLKIPTILWAYRITCKKLIGQTPFKLVYRQEAVVPLEFLVPIQCVAAITNMTKRGTIQERLSQLMELEEDIILAGFHQEVQKERGKACHGRHIKKNIFKEGDLVIFYKIKYLQHSGKFRMH
jgi:hypothetical protein